MKQTSTLRIITPENRKTRGYFYRERKVLKIFGLSLTGDESRSYRVYSFLLLGLTNFAYPCLAVMDVFKHDFSVVSGMMVYQFSAFAALAKTAVMLRNRIKIGKVLGKLEQEPFITDFERGSDVEEKLIHQCLNITGVQTLLYWICASLCIMGAIAFTIFTRLRSDDYHDWQFPYGPFTVINTTYSPNFEITCVYQSLAIVSISAHFATIDLITAAVLAHVSFQFKLLQNSLRCLVERNRREIQHNKLGGHLEKSIIPWKHLKKSVKGVVRHHLAIINIAQELEDVFSNLLLLVFLGTLGMLCFLVYHASMTIDSPLKLIRSFIETCAILFQILTVCYWGEQVMHESQLVGAAAYEADFVGTDQRFQKALVLVIRRSLNPTRLTAGKFVAVCLPTFSWIIRTSYSLFMVLYSHHE